MFVRIIVKFWNGSSYDKVIVELDGLKERVESILKAIGEIKDAKVD